MDLSQYGTIIEKYTGVGQLIQEKYESVGCDFEIAQYVDGAIRLKCTLPSKPVPEIEDEIGGTGRVCFQGQTEDKVTLKIEGMLFQVISKTEWGQKNLVQVVYIGTGEVKLQVGKAQWSGKVKLRFGLTNFLFVGDEREEITPNSWRYNKVTFALDGRQIVIRQLNDYPERKATLKARKDINITCEACIKIDFPEELESVRRLIDNLCQLLTIARGTLVSHAYLNVASSKDDRFYAEHYPSVTRRYNGSLPIITIMLPEKTKKFVESTFERYKDLKPDNKYEIDKIIHSWIDVRSDSFLESRGLTLIANVEHLVNRCADLHDYQLYLPKNEFEDNQDSLVSRTREILVETFDELDNGQIEAMSNKVKGFNRRSFSSKLRRFCRIFKVPIEESEIVSFTQSRNLLVHEMRFQSNTVDERATEFFNMVHLLDRIILRMLNYSGRYFNVSTMAEDELPPTS